MNSKDTFKIICSFLNPLELVNCRKLSIHLNMWTNEYLYHKFKKINIEEYTCPKCGDLIDQGDVSNYTDFYDYFLMDDQKNSRINKITEWFNDNNIFNVQRKFFLCENCETIEDYEEDFDIYFKYKGSREYTLQCYYSLYNWSAICIIINNNGYWNEYRKILSLGSYGEDDDNDNDNDNEQNDYNNYYNE
jgi:hypothetical protein